MCPAVSAACDGGARQIGVAGVARDFIEHFRRGQMLAPCRAHAGDEGVIKDENALFAVGGGERQSGRRGRESRAQGESGRRDFF